MTKKELMENYTSEQLAEMVVELQNGKEKPTMNISDIQKCQDEYEKLLKENPLHGTIDKICKDILEQKNNAIAMEFTRIIRDLLKRYGVYVHCTETKFGEKITTNSIEEQYGIVFDSMDFSQHDKEFTDKIKELEEELEKSNREHAKTLWEYCDSVKKEDYDEEVNHLQSEVEKYRKAFEDAKKERDCQIAEYQKKIEELKVENAELHCEMQAMKVFPDEIPKEPIKVAEMLITAKGECESLHIGNDVFKDTYRIFEVSELRQIAEHLLVYCNHNGEAEE